MFAILITTLPTQPSAVRLRVWRALKAKRQALKLKARHGLL